MPLGTGYGLASGTPVGGFAVLSVVPSGGDTAGSTPVVINVTDTAGVVSAEFSGRPITALSIVNGTQLSGVSPTFTYPASFYGLRSIAFDGTYLWISSVYDDRYVYKVDISLTQPSVVSRIDLSAYGYTPPSQPYVYARQVRVYGNHVFVCIQANNHTVNPAVYVGYCVILDKNTGQVVGHVAVHLDPTSASRAADCRAVTFDGAGNFFIAQTPSSNSTPVATFIRKYSIASVLADFPAFGTPTSSFQLTNSYIEDIDYGGGYIWIAHGQKETFYGQGHITRVHAVTGAESFYTFTGPYTNWCAFTVKYIAGKLLAGASSGIAVSTPILVFDPNTFPSDPVPVPTPTSMHVSGGMAFGQDSDSTSYWFGGYQSGFTAWKFDSGNNVIATVSCNGRPCDFAFDGSKLWVGLSFQGLNRVNVTPGGEAVDYFLNNGGSQLSGSVNVTVTNATETATLVNGYTYGAVPVVQAITPNQGMSVGGTPVLIQVADSTGATGATVGGVPLTGFAIVNATHVSGVTGPHAVGLVDVAVSNSIGSGTLFGAFNYVPVVVQSITPNNGDKAGGTSVVIQVESSVGATGASVGGVPLTGFAIVDGTHVSGTTGSHAIGFADVSVTNGVGTGTLFSAFSYTGLSVSAITPSRSSIDGGTPVTVSVSSTTGVTSVSLGGVNITSFAITGPNTITGVTAAHAIGVVDVVATNGAGPSDPLVGAFEYVNAVDLLTLNSTIRFAAGSSINLADTTVYLLPTVGFPASPVRLFAVWFGTTTAGNSGHRFCSAYTYDFVPTVGGVLNIHSGTIGTAATMKRLTGDSVVGYVDRLDTTIPAGNNVANIFGATEGFLWALVKTPASIDGAQDYELVSGVGGFGCASIALIGPTPQAKFTVPSYINGTTADLDSFPITVPVALNSWMVIMARYNGVTNTKEIRVNGGPWTSGFIYNLSHTQDGQAVGLGFPMPVDAELADVGGQQTTISDKEADRVYLALKALYPAASLPALGA